jgi:glycosyltransferase involved in cell wall biosynthesis
MVLSWQALPSAAAGAFIAKRLGVAHVVRLHGPELVKLGARNARWIRAPLKWVLDHADAVVAKSPQEVERLRASHLGHAVTVIPNVAAPMPRTVATRRHSGSDAAVRLLLVGRLEKIKRVDIAIDALRLLQRQIPGSFTLTIVGHGRLRRHLEEKAARSNLPVRFEGRVPHENVSRFYSTHDLLVHTSEHEGSCNAVLEALSHGLPVVGRYEVLHDVQGWADGAATLIRDISSDTLARFLMDWSYRKPRTSSNALRIDPRRMLDDYARVFSGCLQAR